MLTTAVALAQLSKFPDVAGEPARFRAHYQGCEIYFTVPPDQEPAWLAQVGQGMNVTVVLEVDAVGHADTELPTDAPEPDRAPSTVPPAPDFELNIEEE